MDFLKDQLRSNLGTASTVWEILSQDSINEKLNEICVTYLVPHIECDPVNNKLSQEAVPSIILCGGSQKIGCYPLIDLVFSNFILRISKINYFCSCTSKCGFNAF